MIDTVRADVDDEIIRNLKAALTKGIETTIWIGEDNPLDSPWSRDIWRAFGKIQTRKVRFLSLGERNDTSMTTRAKYSEGFVSLPALQVTYEDPDVPNNYNVLFIEGIDNVIKVLTELAKAQLEHTSDLLGKMGTREYWEEYKKKKTNPPKT